MLRVIYTKSKPIWIVQIVKKMRHSLDKLKMLDILLHEYS